LGGLSKPKLNTKSELRNTKQTQNTKSEYRNTKQYANFNIKKIFKVKQMPIPLNEYFVVILGMRCRSRLAG
jgi:hypothetical protein